MSDLRDELRGGARSVISAAIGAGLSAFASWLKTRPVKRAIERRRARRTHPLCTLCGSHHLAGTVCKPPAPIP